MDHCPSAPSRPRTGSGWVYRAEGLPNYSGGPVPELHRLPYSPHSSKYQNCGAPHAILFPFATLGQTLRTVNTVAAVQQGLLIVLIWAADSRHSRESGNPGLSASDLCLDAKGLWVPAFAGMTLKTKRPRTVQHSLYPAGGTPQGGGYLEGFGSHSNDEVEFQNAMGISIDPDGRRSLTGRPPAVQVQAARHRIISRNRHQYFPN